MGQCDHPDQEEHAHLPFATLGQFNRQQAIGPQQADTGQGKAGHHGQVERLDQAMETLRRGALLGVLASALDAEVQQAGGDHGAADHAAEEVQPAHRISAELGEVQPSHHSLREQARSTLVGHAQHDAADAIE